MSASLSLLGFSGHRPLQNDDNLPIHFAVIVVCPPFQPRFDVGWQAEFHVTGFHRLTSVGVIKCPVMGMMIFLVVVNPLVGLMMPHGQNPTRHESSPFR